MTNLHWRLLDYAEYAMFGGLRYLVFIKLLKWLPEVPGLSTELDDLDPYALHIGVFGEDPQKLLGYARIITKECPHGFLLHKPAFLGLFSRVQFTEEDGEASRFAISLRLPRGVRAYQVAQCLFRGILEVCREQGIRRLWATVDDLEEGLMTRNQLLLLGFEQVSGPHQLAPGVDTYLMVCRDLEVAAKLKTVRMFLDL